MDQSDRDELIKESKNNLLKAQKYLDEIPILKQIHGIGDIKQKKDEFEIDKPENRLAFGMESLLKDDYGYDLSFRKNYLQYTYANAKKKTYFFSFYDLTKDWLRSKFQNDQEYKKKLEELKLDKPYKLAIELFNEYIDFRKNATQDARFQNGRNNNNGLYEPNIYDLFTEDDLAKLGGNEFITDCYEIIGKKALASKYQLNEKTCIQNINSRTSEESKDKNSIKPDLYRRVDNHLSWQIFKDGNIEKLNNEEKSMLQETMEKEGFWKHLKKTALIALALTLAVGLPLVGIVALIHMLATGVALTAVAFMSTFATMAAYFSVPAILAFIIFTPILASMSRKSSIVDNMIKISNKNKEFNHELSDVDNMIKISNKNKEFNHELSEGVKKYNEYKQNHLDFLKLAQDKGGNMTGNEINSIYKEGDNNPESRKRPLEMINGFSEQSTSEKEKDKKTAEKTGH